MKDSITVLLIDDHALVRRGFRRLIEDEPGLSVVGEASDGVEAEALAASLVPDVIVLDYALPGMNGPALARKLLASRREARILILSMHSEPVYVANAFEAGAAGYLLKSALDLELVEAIRKVAAGERVLDRSLPEPPVRTAQRTLTPRELEVLQLIVAGKSNREIAVILGVSVNTVGVHRTNIMDRLDIHNAAELAAYAVRHGLVGLP
ncbi:MAG: response regulator transcription factor [Bryobacterales bacterium]|nr:response regulator transcription factor [Bryobacterales bacterium]